MRCSGFGSRCESTGNQSTHCTKLGILPTSTPFAIGAAYVTLLVVSVYHLWSFQKIGGHKNIFHLQAGLGTLQNKYLYKHTTLDSKQAGASTSLGWSALIQLFSLCATWLRLCLSEQMIWQYHAYMHMLSYVYINIPIAGLLACGDLKGHKGKHDIFQSDNLQS